MFFTGFYNQSPSTSPTRTSVWNNVYSPFRSTTTQMPEICLDDTTFIAAGPGAGAGVGRTIKDYEDELAAVKKENFNLKLRIYMLEEKICKNSNFVNGDAIKKNIELQVENESLKNDLNQNQKLLSQAAQAFKLIEEQKEESSKILKMERGKVAQLEKELQEYKEKEEMENSAYYKSLIAEQSMVEKEKLDQLQELVQSLEAENKSIALSLEEERSWINELETEREQLKTRLEVEMQQKEKCLSKRDRDIDELKEKIDEYRHELKEKDEILQRTNSLLEDSSKACEKRTKQIEQLRLSLKDREDAVTDISNKYRELLSQFESRSSREKRSPGKLSSSPVSFWKDAEEIKELRKKLDDQEQELKRYEDSKKQLIIKLCNTQKDLETKEQKIRKLETELEKALITIRGLLDRGEQLEERVKRKTRKITELEAELQSRNGKNVSDETLDNHPERDESTQQRFDDMEDKINDLKHQIDAIKSEKIELEKQIQIEAQELEEKLKTKDNRIETLESENSCLKEDLKEKFEELQQLKESYEKLPEERDRLLSELNSKTTEISEKNLRIEQLSKELQIKTQNLQKLVNTELWSKNKEIAKLHNHYVTSPNDKARQPKNEFVFENRLTNLLKELDNLGIKINFADDENVELSYYESETKNTHDLKDISNYMKKLLERKIDLEKEVDYLQWLKLVTKPLNAEISENITQSEKAEKYCELLREHLKQLMEFLKQISSESMEIQEQKIVLDILLDTKILPENFMNVLVSKNDENRKNVISKSRSDNYLENNRQLNQSDSEAFSEPDRTVSMARIGLRETQRKCQHHRSKFTKYTKTHSSDSDVDDDDDSIEYVPYHKTYQSEINVCDFDTNCHINSLKETNNQLYSELSALRNDLKGYVSFESNVDEKLHHLLGKLERSQKYSEKLQVALERRVNECHSLRKDSKQTGLRKSQLEKRIVDVETMAAEVAQQKSEILQYKENAERKAAEMIMALNRENESLRLKVKKLEDERESLKLSISKLTKELDLLTLQHSQTLVENTKLTNDKLRLEQEIRKMENRYDLSVRTLHDKFSKEVTDLNQINDSHVARMEELEAANKELRRHVVVCEASDSAPSSSGVSSIPTDSVLKRSRDDITHEYQSYNSSQYWLPVTYGSLNGRSKSSCSPDLGIESDTAGTTMLRPLKETLKITESMTNLLSDEDHHNHNLHNPRDNYHHLHFSRIAGSQDLDHDENPSPIEGLDEVEILKKENENLKRRLMKTRRALEDTFQHLSTSNKNKKNVEKAITKQLMITKSILKKTRTYEEPFDN